MSLTSLLKNDKHLKTRFRETFDKPWFTVKKEMLAPPETEHYAMVGTAFDYLLRFYLKRLNPDAESNGKWIAEQSLDLLDGKLLDEGEKVVEEARKNQEAFLETGKVTDGLVASAISLARLDPVFRAGVGHRYIGTSPDEGDMRDLKNLISVVPYEPFKAEDLCLLNPMFGEASVMVGGADADLLIDDTIIDIKTTKRFNFRRKAFNQLLGYYTLHKISGIGMRHPKPQINKIAVYFSRHGYLHTIDLQEVESEGAFSEFADWFEEYVGEKLKNKVTVTVKTAEGEANLDALA